MLDFFSWDQKSTSRRLLLVAEQGSGKSTAIRRSTQNWCDHVQNPKRRNLLQMKNALKRLYEKYYQPPAWIFDSLRELLSWLRDNLEMMREQTRKAKLPSPLDIALDFGVSRLTAPLKNKLDFGVRLLSVPEEWPELLLVFELNHCGKGGRL